MVRDGYDFYENTVLNGVFKRLGMCLLLSLCVLFHRYLPSSYPSFHLFFFSSFLSSFTPALSAHPHDGHLNLSFPLLSLFYFNNLFYLFIYYIWRLLFSFYFLVNVAAKGVDADLQSAAAQVSSLVSLPSSLSSSLTQQATAGTVICHHSIYPVSSDCIISHLFSTYHHVLFYTSPVPFNAHAHMYAHVHVRTLTDVLKCTHTYKVYCITVMSDVIHCNASHPPSLIPLLTPSISSSNHSHTPSSSSSSLLLSSSPLSVQVAYTVRYTLSVPLPPSPPPCRPLKQMF